MIKPYSESNDSKRVQIETMFNNIAWRYDFLNHFLSLGIDKIWRRKAIRIIGKNHPKQILDVASGTGDFAIQARFLNPDQIYAVDIAEKMLAIASEKIKKRNLEKLISTQLADAENLPFENSRFDAITVAFGVRNFETLTKGLSEMLRVLQPGGVVAILEFSMPKAFVVKAFYNFYFSVILPFFGKMISKDKAAYTYLPNSVKNFPERDHFLSILNECGYKNTFYKPLSFGIACLYIGYK